MRTLLEGEGVCSGVGEGGTDCSGEIEGDGDSSGRGEGVGVGDSCAAAIATKATQKTKVTTWKGRSAIRDLSIISPVHVGENVVSPFAIAQKFFINHRGDKLIVQAIETSKVVDRALGRVFARSPCFH